MEEEASIMETMDITTIMVVNGVATTGEEILTLIIGEGAIIHGITIS